MKKVIFSLFFIIACSSLKAQQIASVKKSNLLPSSIYTLKNGQNEFNSISVNKKLNFNSLSFVLIDAKDIENGNFSIPFKHIGKKPSSIYDDYNDYQYNNLLKGFSRKYDLTRWQPRELQLQ